VKEGGEDMFRREDGKGEERGKELTVCNVHPCVLHIICDTDIFRRVERVGELKFCVLVFDLVHRGC
jgi:hypothetical protein